jgi:hypothetical protein
MTAHEIADLLENTQAAYLLIGGRHVIDPAATHVELETRGLERDGELTNLGREVQEILRERDPYEIARRAAVRRFERAVRRLEKLTDPGKAREGFWRAEKAARGYVDAETLASAERHVMAHVRTNERAAAERRAAGRRVERERLDAEIAEQRRNDWRRW